MAIEWGAWEGPTNQEMRVGIDVSWEAVSHSEGAVTATIKIYTDVTGSWSDDQSLNFGGSIGGSTSFHNGQSNDSVLRETKTYTYNYGSNEYGSSPGNRTFSATLSGAYNGITPSKSVTSKIPSRPIAAPNDPTNVKASYISDTSIRVTWTNKDSAGNPWNTVRVQRQVNNGSWSTRATLGGGASSYTDDTNDDTEYQYRVRAENGAGDSAYVNTDTIWTTPDAPTNAVRTGPLTGGDQTVSWTNHASTNDYGTEIWHSVNGGAWAKIGEVGDGVSSYTEVGTSAADSIKYRVRAVNQLGGASRPSDWSNETTATAGVTTPPLAPTKLTPAGITVDPTLSVRLAWVFVPGQTGDTQTKFTVFHRLVGSSTWTTFTSSTANQFYDLPANTYGQDAEGNWPTVEWSVQTYGADPNPSPMAAPVQFNTAVTPIAPDPVKLPVLMDLFTGQLEASSTAYEVRNYTQRAQAQLMGGGRRSVDSSYGIDWSQRFIAISMGRSSETFPQGFHEIVRTIWFAAATKSITNNVATIVTTANNMTMRPGEVITVTGVGAPYDGEHVVRSITSTAVSFDCVAPNAASTAATGFVYATIHGHGGAADTAAVDGKIVLPSWHALYYELPFGWGSGDTPRKNGVVAPTTYSWTTDSVTFNVPAPHYFGMSDRVVIQGTGSSMDGEHTVTGVTTTTVTLSVTNTTSSASIAVPEGTLLKPSGKDTFHGNFHIVDYHSDFVIPDNWIMLAVRNGDAATVAWINGDTVDPGFDSDSPVFKQAVFTSTTDVNDSAGNKPAVRIGNTTGVHMRIDGNEIQAMADDNTKGGLNFNINGGDVNIGISGSHTEVRSKSFQLPNFDTSTNNANVYMGGAGAIYRSTSVSRFKLEQEPISVAAARGLLSLTPKTWYDRGQVERNDGSTEGLLRIPGLVAEDVEEHAPTWATYGADGELDGVAYDRVAAGLIVIVQEQEERLAAQERTIEGLADTLAAVQARLSDLEGR